MHTHVHRNIPSGTDTLKYTHKYIHTIIQVHAYKKKMNIEAKSTDANIQVSNKVNHASRKQNQLEIKNISYESSWVQGLA